MSKIPVWMDLISGLLLVTDLIPKKSWFGKLHRGLRRVLEEIDTSNPSDPKTIIFNLLGAIFAFFTLLSWAWYRSGGKGDNIWQEIGLFFVGIIAGAIVINLVAMLFKRMFGDAFASLLFVAGLALSMFFLILGVRLNKSAEFVVALIALVYMCILIPFTTLIANHVRKILLGTNETEKEKPFYMFALLGAAIFIISKVIELVV